jgi:tRNA dimethylallyltransferase
MLREDLIEETRKLIGKYGISARPFGSLGYKQAAEFLRGDLSSEQTLPTIQQAHRNYAKRQMTWFRREPEVTWFHGFGEDPEIQRQVVSLLGPVPGSGS